MKITPSWIATFETNVQTLIVDSWQRAALNTHWSKFMETRPSVTLRELYFWLVESAKIVDEGLGGNKRFDDIAAASMEIANKRSGLGLRLTKDEISDNMMASPHLKGMPALDYAANWARQMGGNAGYWPQQLLHELRAAGESALAYDGKAFFATDHPINPALAGGASYSNLVVGAGMRIDTSVTLDVAAANLAAQIARIHGLTQPNGKPRNLRVKYLLCGPLLATRAVQLLDTKYLTTAAVENVVSRYGIEPIVAAEETSDTNYELYCDPIPGEGGAYVFQERESYVLTSYSSDSESQLQRMKRFEWDFDGRNAGAYGHPYLAHRHKPA